MLGNRHSQHNFAQVPAVHMTRSVFDRSSTAKDTFVFDYLTPCFLDEILPGDTHSLQLEMFARLATQKVPIMDNLFIDFFFFFVPNRLLWDHWEQFNGASDTAGIQPNTYLIPTITTTAGTGEIVGSIYDHLGIPTQVPGLAINALPLRAYNFIYDEWFRSQDVQGKVGFSKGDGPDTPGTYTLLKRAKRHDYFTSALPWPQKGPNVSMPLGATAPVMRYPAAAAWQVYRSGTNTLNSSMVGFYTDGSGNLIADGATDYGASFDPSPGGTGAPGLYADLSSATAATINQLRQAFSIQSLYELDARGGTRYVEILLAHFNVTSPDFRLQRPEYLGGGQVRINSHPIAQTAPTTGTNAQAQLAAFSTASNGGSNIGYSHSFVEHGFVMGLMCARADITYQQGLERFWSRQTRFDFFWPKLQELGEQTILNKEIYAQGTANPTADATAFGYQERYAEYRYKPSQIRGQFRSSYATSLDFWHQAQQFGSLPSLNSTFMNQNTPIDRALAITGSVHLIIDMWFKLKHARPMLTYSVPSILGRF